MKFSFDLLSGLTVCCCALASIVPLVLVCRQQQHHNQSTNRHPHRLLSQQDNVVESSFFSGINENYDGLHREPYQSQSQSQSHSSCMARRIHISPATNVNQSDNKVSMTVSFMLDKQHCHKQQQQQHVTPYVYYKSSDNSEQQQQQQYHDDEITTTTTTTTMYKATASPIHFNYTSSTTGEYYESDYIYHVVLPNLHANTMYKYRIDVVIESRDEETTQKEVTTVLSNTMETTSNSVSSPVRRQRRLGDRDTAVGLSSTTTPDLFFTTPPLPDTPTSIAMVGDLGQTSDSIRTVQHIYRAATTTTKNARSHTATAAAHGAAVPAVTLLHIVGDLSYADSNPHRWNTWLDVMQPLLERTALIVAPGNHEIECDAMTHVPWMFYEHYFRNPNRIEPVQMDVTEQLHDCSTPSVFQGNYNYGNSFYAYRHGLANMIVLNSYTHSHIGSTQYRWLEDQLKRHWLRNHRRAHEYSSSSATTATTTTRPPSWLVVSFHSPIYNTFRDHVNETQALEMQHAMEALFVKYKVNVVISGHCHAYMRSHPVAFGKRRQHNDDDDDDGTAPIYIIVGAGGNREGHSSGYQHDDPEPWVAKRDVQEFGYGHLYLANRTHAKWTWVRDDDDDDDGVRDHVWIVNHHVSSSPSSSLL